ncbi:hypothetical protein [Shinella zoogloeoides]|uniref:hypothetical protein n=1 Tax=Shinella zoogloeoides TaxID=352475 RepID=UPI00299D6747|nr:hypothetical protein [Shinella zoogloeoides]WPE24032.1 hypothetical protein ShzoTeo12_52520 [Shinella zoogloeoides]
MTAWSSMAEGAGRRLRRNGLTGGLIALLVLALAPPTAGAEGFAGPLAWWLLLAFCLLPLVFSVHLLFDAALFRLGASYGEEATGLAAVDDVLARMGLRARDGVVRTMPERLAGCRRLLWLQRVSLAIGVMLYAVLLLDAVVGT